MRTGLEFRSGVGNMARFFNGNQPFVDDLEFQIEENNSVCQGHTWCTATPCTFPSVHC